MPRRKTGAGWHWQVVGPLGDRDVGTGAGQDRGDTEREHCHQPVSASAGIAWIGHRGQHGQQVDVRLGDEPGLGTQNGDRGRCAGGLGSARLGS